ncbi:LuxR C-terminal-related transcriptional regulator [Pendulispora brunnea]|uniref:LuxR C-terminal-related transcriptional regulator n=1 Tax=Pendulispora brunnea TaxID=2905690 RepID=A0ABZ2KIU8_9BACT
MNERNLRARSPANAVDRALDVDLARAKLQQTDPEVSIELWDDLTHRERQTVAMAALGHSNKVIADELGLSVSAVSAYLARAARKLRVDSRVDLARLYRDTAPRPPSAADDRRPPPRADTAKHLPPKGLSASERAVLLGVLCGKTNAEIAQARRSSVRTVANQVASAFRKLGVSSRGELAARMFRESDASNPSAAK